MIKRKELRSRKCMIKEKETSLLRKESLKCKKNNKNNPFQIFHIPNLLD